MSVNPTKKTPAPVAGGRGGRGRCGRGRSKELPILDHAAVGEDVVETPTRSPSSSPQVSCSRSGSGESRESLMLVSQAMEKEVAHLQGWFKGIRDNFARLDKLPKSGSGQRVFTERELWTLQKMHFLQKITSPMRVEREVMRGWGRDAFIYTMATFCVHATHTLETRLKNAGRAGHALEACWVCARGALCVR